jgi:hypothetical protein
MEEESKKPDHRKKFKGRLPNKIVPIKNRDKQNHEAWYEHRNICNFPRPYRCILVGGVNSGKTLCAKNIILRAHPAFDRIILCHCDSESKEWSDLDIPEEDQFYSNEIPPLEFFNGKPENEKWLVILEDIEFKNEGKNENLSTLFRYISTHKNTSVLLMYQNFITVPKIARRLANIFVIWKMPDRTQMETIGAKVGLKKGVLLDMFEKLCPNRYDNLCFDMTTNSPAPIRLNLFDKVIVNNKNEKK